MAAPGELSRAIARALKDDKVLASVLRDARAEAWQEGWDARAKYLGTDGAHWPGRNPYRGPECGTCGDHFDPTSDNHCLVCHYPKEPA